MNIDFDTSCDAVESERWRERRAASNGTFEQKHPDLEALEPTPEQHSKLLEMLGQLNYRTILGDPVYIRVGEVAYRILYAIYWRSVYSGIEHFLLKCEEIKQGMWAESDTTTTEVDLPIRYTREGWMVGDYSLKLMLYQDLPQSGDGSGSPGPALFMSPI